MLPRSGDVLNLTQAASPQFAAPVLFRTIRVLDWDTYDGWTWLDGYQLNSGGDAVARRSVFVKVNGLQRAHLPPAGRQKPGTARRSNPLTRRDPR